MLVLFIFCALCIAWSEANCGPCPQIPKHYEELGCKGIFSKDGGCCPERFECPDITKYDKSQCHYKGRSYINGKDLEENVGPACSTSCKCIGFSEEPTFNCANIECPDLFNRPPEDCVLQYSHDKCCSDSMVCGKVEVDKLHKCHYRGMDYSKGQKIYPNDFPCYQCICDEKFDNSTMISANEQCRKIDCGIELRYLERLQKGCVPVYFGDNGCCPIEFKCPKEDDEVEPLEGRADIVDDVDMQCTFNNLTLLRSEKLKTNEKCVECVCEHPPMVDCKRIPDC